MRKFVAGAAVLAASAALAGGLAAPALAAPANGNGNADHVQACKTMAAANPALGDRFFAACVTYGYGDTVGSVGAPGSGATAVWVCTSPVGLGQGYANQGQCVKDIKAQINDKRKG